MGHATAGTFETDAAIGPRVVMTSGGKLPFAIGSGEISMANALMAFDKTTNTLVFRGKLNIRSSTQGGRLEIENDYIRVYDDKNVLRVEIGELT